MKLLKYCLIFLALITGSPVVGQSNPTKRVPLCLQFPDRGTRVPCTGVVPVETETGDALSWGDLLKGSVDDPRYIVETQRRSHAMENTSPLAANNVFIGQTRDDGSADSTGTSRWRDFACVVVADQPGTLEIQASNTSTNWITVQSRASVANVSLVLITPTFTKYWRCRFTNTGSSQTYIMLNSSFG